MRYIFFLFYLSIIIPTIWTALGIFIRTSRPQGSGKVYFWSRINLLQFSFLKMSLRIILENIKQGFITWTLTMKWYRGLQNKLDYNFLISVYPRTNIDHKQRSRRLSFICHNIFAINIFAIITFAIINLKYVHLDINYTCHKLHLP